MIDRTPEEIALYLHPKSADKLRRWGSMDSRFIDMPASATLRVLGLVEPMGGGVMRITDVGKQVREVLFPKL